MVSLMKKLLSQRSDRLFFAGIIIIAANAGGAWSPIGDVTTTMLWIGGQITTLAIMKGRVFALHGEFTGASCHYQPGLERQTRSCAGRARFKWTDADHRF
jgi:hypothetical protein